MKTIYVIEDFEHLPQVRIGRFPGINWLKTPYWRISPIWSTLVVFLFAIFRLRKPTLVELVCVGVVYALLINISILLHIVGHLVAGKRTGHPKQGIHLTSTLPVKIDDGVKYPSRVHLIRSMGVPLMNLFIGFILLMIDKNIFKNHLISFMAYVNFLFFISAMLPIPTMDGGVLVRELSN